MHKLKKLAEDAKCEPKHIFNYSREVDPTIPFSLWFRNDQTIKPRVKKYGHQDGNQTTPDMEFKPDAADLKTMVLKTFQIASSKPRVSGIFFIDQNTIEEFVSEYTASPANCPLMCACKGDKAEITRLWKDVETLNNRGVELYIPYRADEQIMATKVTAFQICTGDLEIIDIQDNTDSSKDIK